MLLAKGCSFSIVTTLHRLQDDELTQKLALTGVYFLANQEKGWWPDSPVLASTIADFFRCHHGRYEARIDWNWFPGSRVLEKIS
jgi:hypothetical protein